MTACPHCGKTATDDHQKMKIKKDMDIRRVVYPHVKAASTTTTVKGTSLLRRKKAKPGKSIMDYMQANVSPILAPKETDTDPPAHTLM